MKKVLSYWWFRCRAQTDHGLHSPFAYAFYTQCLVPYAKSSKANNDQELWQHLECHYQDRFKIKRWDGKERLNSDHDLWYLPHAWENPEAWKLACQDQSVCLSIHFFYGALFVMQPIAPKQSFYLKI